MSAWSLDRLYAVVAKYPGGASLGILGTVLVLAVLPQSVLTATTLYAQNPEWAARVFTFATLVLGVVGGVIPIVKWRAEMVLDITQRKPIVVTNLLANEDVEIQNLSDAMAVNVWCLPITGRTLCLGGLAPQQSRRVTALEMRRPHVLIAEARPQGFRPRAHRRQFVVTFNVLLADAGFRHGWDEKSAADGRLWFDRTIHEYLRNFGAALVDDLRCFEATPPPSLHDVRSAPSPVLPA